MGLVVIAILIAVILLEITGEFIIKKLRKKFQWLITTEDERPYLDPEGLKKFIKHGYDSELGWIRKPNTEHFEKGKHGETSYHIDELGARRHPGLEDLPRKIACFGDSFTFSRQVNDNETWAWYLSSLTGAGVLNFGVGNYGIDQAYLRMKREIKKINPEVVIMGVVPSTIVRILCVWKHYNEFGNTFGFKPRFDLKDGNLTLVKNIIDTESKFYEYDKFLKEIQKNDYFYLTKFRDEMIKFPYLYSILRKPARNLSLITGLLLSNLAHSLGMKSERLDDYGLMKIMKINRNLRCKLFKDKYATDLFCSIIEKFRETAKEEGIKPVFLFMPQKDDILFIRKNGSYYDEFTKRIREKILTIDITDHLINADNLDELYSDENEYGGHFSKYGNELIAGIIQKDLTENEYLDNPTGKNKQNIDRGA